jgi:methylglutaconyl-CoA hydratase
MIMANKVGAGTVLWEIDKRGVASITLDRPKVNNAYNGDLIDGLH